AERIDRLAAAFLRAADRGIDLRLGAANLRLNLGHCAVLCLTDEISHLSRQRRNVGADRFQLLFDIGRRRAVGRIRLVGRSRSGLSHEQPPCFRPETCGQGKSSIPLEPYRSWLNQSWALASCLSMIFSENRCPLFGIMLYPGKFISSCGQTCPRTTMQTISSGTARNAPIGPHSHVQNTSAKNTKNGLSVRRLPTMLGVMKWPSSVAIPTNSAGASAACASDGIATSPTANSTVATIA